MKRSSYGERDSTFGQMMLTLRTSLGLTQAQLAEWLGVSRRAVAEWEEGSNYPKAERLKELITLGVRASAFPAGREAEAICALWKAAHRKVLLDEPWLQRLMGNQRPSLALVVPSSVGETATGERATLQLAQRPRVDWGEAIDLSTFYNREKEAATLAHWVVRERCQMVSVLVACCQRLRNCGSSWFLVSRSEIPVPDLLLPTSSSTFKHRARVVAAGEQSPHDHTSRA
jgi:transcriptional regulator with XRE-family HTH domain